MSKFAHLKLVKVCYKDGGHLLIHENHAWEYASDQDFESIDTQPTDEEIQTWIANFEAPAPKSEHKPPAIVALTESVDDLIQAVREDLAAMSNGTFSADSSRWEVASKRVDEAMESVRKLSRVLQ